MRKTTEDNDMFGKYEDHQFTTKYGSKRTISIPKDGVAWQLYSTKGSGLAAYRMKRALIKSFAKLVEVATETGSLSKGVIEADRLHQKTRWANANADHGSADTEPRCVAQQAIADFARAWSGTDASFYDFF